MNEEKIDVLRHLIEERLRPLVNSDYVFIDLPYHPNVGDALIAFAAEKFLKNTPYRCLYRSSGYTFDDRAITPKTLIIFNGGGNFGDLWESYTIFRNKIILRYPENHYLIFPQSVCYNDAKKIEEDVRVYATCGRRMTICARDKDSYDFLKSNFTQNNILLVPDMAFYTDDCLLKPKSGNGRILFLKRQDKEFAQNHQYDIVPDNAEIHDWPTMERFMHWHWKYLHFKQVTRECRWYPKLFLHIEDFIWQRIILPYYLRCGISFVNQYDIVYSTRLHVAILGVLLGKQVYFFDNSYGKNSSLFNTWLKGFPNIQLVS